MNNKQKRVLLFGIAIIALSFVLWQLYGGEIFTKTEVLVEERDKIFDRKYEQLQDKFIWGLDLTLLICGITTVISGMLFQKFKNN